MNESIVKDQYYLDLRQSLMQHPLRISQYWGQSRNYDYLAEEYHLDSHNTLKKQQEKLNPYDPKYNQKLYDNYFQPWISERKNYQQNIEQQNNPFDSKYTDSILKEIQNHNQPSILSKNQKNFQRYQDSSNIKEIHPHPAHTEKFNIYLCTEIGNIQGILTVTEHIVEFEPDVLLFHKNYPELQIKHHQTETSILSYQFVIDLRDIFTFQLTQEVCDVYANTYDVYLHIFLEETKDHKSPITDQYGNIFVLKVCFKSIDSYQGIQDSNNIGKTYINYIAKKILYNTLKKKDISKNYAGQSVIKHFEKVNIKELQHKLHKKSKAQKKMQINIQLPKLINETKIFSKKMEEIKEQVNQENGYLQFDEEDILQSSPLLKYEYSSSGGVGGGELESCTTYNSVFIQTQENNLQQQLFHLQQQNQPHIKSPKGDQDLHFFGSEFSLSVREKLEENIERQKKVKQTSQYFSGNVDQIQNIQQKQQYSSPSQQPNTTKPQRRKIFTKHHTLNSSQDSILSRQSQQSICDENPQIPKILTKQYQRQQLHSSNNSSNSNNSNNIMDLKKQSSQESNISYRTKKSISNPHIQYTNTNNPFLKNKRKELKKLTYSHSRSNNLAKEQEEQQNYLQQEKNFTKQLSELGRNQFREIVLSLPSLYSNRDWHLIFSPSKNGYSYSKFLRRTQDLPCHMILIKDTNNYVFGAYLTEGWKKSNKCYGNGESFIFSLKKGEIMKWEWSYSQDYQNYQYCDDKGIYIGMDDGIGLFINSEFYKGISQRCKTFANQPLTNKDNFVIQEFEVWGFEEYIEEQSFNYFRD